MNEGVRKLSELTKTDEAFQAKLKEALESYAGDADEETVFSSVVAPLAAEYGVSVTYDEMKACAENLKNNEMDPDELSQVAGGDGFYGITTGGISIGFCNSSGWGIGGGYGSKGGIICFIKGYGNVNMMCAFAGEGTSGDK